MKQFSYQQPELRKLAAVTAALVLAGVTHLHAGKSMSPVGTWDLTISGSHQQGIAFLTFEDDGTNKFFNGFRLLSGKGRSLSSDGRNPAGDAGRNGGSTNSVSFTNIFGFEAISGPWQFDERGRIIGEFVHTLAVGTNAIYLSDSFVGKASARRLTLRSSTDNGNVTYSGRPYESNLVDLSGPWFARKQITNKVDLITFDLHSFAQGDPSGGFSGLENFPNVYWSTNGVAATNTFSAIAVLSRSRKIGFEFDSLPADATSNVIMSATLGTLGNSRSFFRARTRGDEFVDGVDKSRIGVDAVHLK